MNRVSIRQFGDPVLTRPIQTRDARIRDTILDDKFRIDTDTRILPEPANRIAPGDMGVRLDGSRGGPPEPADVDLLFNSFVAGMGMLTREEVARMKALMLKFAGAPAGRTNAVGITSTSADTRRSIDSARRNSEELQAINANNRASWEKQYAETARAIYGGR